MSTQHLGNDKRVFEREGILCLACVHTVTLQITYVRAYVLRYSNTEKNLQRYFSSIIKQ